jgi:hypothetical protein
LFPGFPDETVAWQEWDGRYDESVNLDIHHSDPFSGNTVTFSGGLT